MVIPMPCKFGESADCKGIVRGAGQRDRQAPAVPGMDRDAFLGEGYPEEDRCMRPGHRGGHPGHSAEPGGRGGMTAAGRRNEYDEERKCSDGEDCL